MYIIINEVEATIEDKNGNKYLTYASTDKNKNVLEKYTELWKKIKNIVEKISDKPSKYEKDYMKINFNSDDNLQSNKILKLHNLTVIVRSVFEEGGKILSASLLRQISV